MPLIEAEFLGTGTSSGIPIPSCPCAVCHSTDPKDRRWRSSLLLRNGGRNTVVDMGPEFRLQCLRAGVDSLDAILLTHHHADHINGLDDVRAFSFRLPGLPRENAATPVWASRHSIDFIHRRFDYIWNARQVGGGLPKIDLREAAGGVEFRAGGLAVTPVPIMHGLTKIFGYRIGDLAYLTDISEMPEASLPLVEGVATLVTSCALRTRHETHFSLSDVIALHERVGPRLTLITHLSHGFGHRELLDELPDDIRPAYDGMRFTVTI